MFKDNSASPRLGIPAEGSSDRQGAGRAVAPYLDYLANDLEQASGTVQGRPIEELQRELVQSSRWASEWLRGRTEVCRHWSTVGFCEDGHQQGRTLLCGREWCDDCGLVDSDAHLRRFHRWLPKLQQLRRCCQIVVTFPDEVRRRLRATEELTRVAVACSRELRRLGVLRGVRRWHWFGDEQPGKVMRWHPHLNFLLDCGYFGRLDEFKRFVAELVGVECVVHAEFGDEPAQIVHMAKYILRATFRRFEWDPEMAVVLHGFRNIGQWGKWADEPVWQLETVETEGNGVNVKAVQALEKNQCPCCGKPMRWTKVVRTDSLRPWILEGYGAGYFRLPDLDAEGRARARPACPSGSPGGGRSGAGDRDGAA